MGCSSSKQETTSVVPLQPTSPGMGKSAANAKLFDASDSTHVRLKRSNTKLIRQKTRKDVEKSYLSSTLSVVVVGGSGDLAKKKTFPSLLQLYLQGFLPENKTSILAYARSEYTDDSFRAKIEPYLKKYIKDENDKDKKLRDFLGLITYMRGTSYGDENAWGAVNDKMNEIEGGKIGNRLFYFAIPPTQFGPAGTGIRKKAMDGKGWHRMIIEKPFGRDSASSLEMSKELSALFEEDQIYRIDHYLGKEMVQNLLVLRFSNLFLEPLWSKEHIKSIIITFKENIGTQGRGGYFDEFGIIRDVMQNHLLQIFSLIAMEKPERVSGKGYSDLVRDEKVKVLKQVKPLTVDDVILGQYVGNPQSEKKEEQEGYLDDKTVPEGSVTPTYALAKFSIDNSRWKGVPILIKCGKALNERKAEIRIQFKQPSDVKNTFDGQDVPCNELVMRVS